MNELVNAKGEAWLFRQTVIALNILLLSSIMVLYTFLLTAILSNFINDSFFNEHE